MQAESTFGQGVAFFFLSPRWTVHRRLPFSNALPCEAGNDSAQPMKVDTFNVEELFLSRGPISSAEVRGLVIHDIEEAEGERQQEEQENGRDKKIGEVEEVKENAQQTHETWR